MELEIDSQQGRLKVGKISVGIENRLHPRKIQGASHQIDNNGTIIELTKIIKEYQKLLLKNQFYKVHPNNFKSPKKAIVKPQAIHQYPKRGNSQTQYLVEKQVIREGKLKCSTKKIEGFKIMMVVGEVLLIRFFNLNLRTQSQFKTGVEGNKNTAKRGN
jgi:hypothetical protein